MAAAPGAITREWLAALLDKASASAPPPLATTGASTPHLPLLLIAAVAVVALALPSLVATVDAWRRWHRLPGPPAFQSLLGHAPLLSTPRSPMALLEFAETYGDVYRIRLAHRPAVVVGDPLLFAALTKRTPGGLRLPKSKDLYASLNIGIEGRPNSILTELEDTPAWAAVRKAIAPAFSVASLRAHVFPDLRDALEQVTAHLEREHARLVLDEKHPPHAAEVDVESLAKRITADVIFTLLLGKPLGGTAAFCAEPLPAVGASGTADAKRREHQLADAAIERLLAADRAGDREAMQLDASEYMSMVEALLESAARVLQNPLRAPLAPLLRLLGDADAQRDARLERAFGAMMRARVDKLERCPPPEGTVARAILAAVDPSTDQRLPPERRASELSVVLNAGFETTSRAIVCTLAALAERPQMQERVAEELRAAGLSGARRRPLEYSDLSPSALPYLHAVVKESLRLYPPAALGTGRVVPAGAPAICGRDVPPGTIVLMPTYVSGRRSTAYGPDAAVFNPSRWLSSSDSSSPPPPEPPSFSYGSRDCVGQPLARVELVAAVAALVAAFKWRPADRVTQAGGLEALLRFAITLGTEHGMPLVFEPR
jgi:cytochrome P450